MNVMRMLLPQPRHVVVKLNGMSSGEANEVFEKITGAEWGPDRQPVFSVARCRAATVDVRTGPVATVRSATERLVARHEEQLARQDERLSRQQEQLAHYEEQFARSQEESRETQVRIAGVWRATVANNPKESTGISPEQVGGMVGKEERWDAPRVRKYAREGKFPKSLHPRKKNAPYVFDPIMVLEDIADIKKGLRKGRRKS